MKIKLITLFLGGSFWISGCLPQESAEVKKWIKQAENIEIIRDDFGVPHIYGKTDADAVFGLLYAQCEDDFPRVERNYIWAIGRLAEIEGESAIYSDVRARMFMTQDEAIEAYNEAPEWLQKLCDAFADGVNYYLHSNPQVKPKLLTRFEPWMPMYFSEGSIGGDIERVSTSKIKAFYENEKISNLSDPSLFELAEPKGSNGFAISGERTASGNAMLLINPHTSFYFRGEVHMVSEEGLNAYGAVTWGQFFVYQGFNENTGWMHTSTYVDVIDEYIEEVKKLDDGYVYQYGNEERPVEYFEETFKYKSGNDVSEKSIPIYRTHHGPVTHSIDGKWVSTALMWEPKKALEQSFVRTKMKNHGEFREMMNIRTNSSNNTVFADSEGNIAYYHGNFVPKRNEQFDFTEPVNGSNPETDWMGLHPVEECIQILNPSTGWIQNCNSTPFTAAGDQSPKAEDYPKYMSINRENFRGVNAIRLLNQSAELTLESLIELAYNPYLAGFEKVIPGLIEAFDDNQDKYPSLKEPIEVLRQWNLTTSTESVGMSLAHFYGMELLQNAVRPGDLTGMASFNYFGTDFPPRDRLSHFKNSVDKLQNDFGTWNTPWGEINRFQRLSGAISAPFDDNQPSIAIGQTTGRWGALAAYGMRSKQQTKKIYGTRGNSFVAVVEFGEKVTAKSLLAGGQSGDENSPHFNDQAQRYADADFKDILFYKEDVTLGAKRTYRPGGK